MHPHWYPGHMHKARKEINQTLSQVDVVLEVVDARLPYSSSNPFVGNIRKQKPTVILLNKTDLADPDITQRWQNFFKDQGLSTHAISKEKNYKGQLIELCKQAAPHKVHSFKAINAMIMGIPNVGKSTIINSLAEKNIAKVGNEPAVTKRQQKINVNNELMLHDTPGILWPKFKNPNAGYRLAIAGSIRDTAITYEDIGFYAIEYLAKHYSQALCERYHLKLEQLEQDTLSIVELIGSQRGAKMAGGRIDLHKACEIIVHEYRAKKLGGVSLETPEMIAQEMAQIELERAEKEQDN